MQFQLFLSCVKYDMEVYMFYIIRSSFLKLDDSSCGNFSF